MSDLPPSMPPPDDGDPLLHFVSAQRLWDAWAKDKYVAMKYRYLLFTPYFQPGPKRATLSRRTSKFAQSIPVFV